MMLTGSNNVYADGAETRQRKTWWDSLKDETGQTAFNQKTAIKTVSDEANKGPRTL